MSVEINLSNVIKKAETQTCGVVMPISAIEDCTESHWIDVKDIIFKAAELAEMRPQLVSDDIEIGIIHKRIVQNIYDNPVVICDISCKNPNVMLEFGMRLAFDRPVIVVKDDKTNYSFDSSPIEHLTYPRDLHYQSILAFQEKLREKIVAMLNGKNESSFLKSFGTFKVSKLEHTEGTPLDYILEELKVIKSALRRVEVDSAGSPSFDDGGLREVTFQSGPTSDGPIRLQVVGSERSRAQFVGSVKAMEGVIEISRKRYLNNREILMISTVPLLKAGLYDKVLKLAASANAGITVP